MQEKKRKEKKRKEKKRKEKKRKEKKRKEKKRRKCFFPDLVRWKNELNILDSLGRVTAKSLLYYKHDLLFLFYNS